MIIRERVLGSILAMKIHSNPELAKEFGIEIITDEDTAQENLDNCIKEIEAITSTDA